MVFAQKGGVTGATGIFYKCLQSLSFSNDKKEETLNMKTKANGGQVFNKR